MRGEASTSYKGKGAAGSDRGDAFAENQVLVGHVESISCAELGESTGQVCWIALIRSAGAG